jgi:hypothetical protein
MNISARRVNLVIIFDQANTPRCASPSCRRFDLDEWINGVMNLGPPFARVGGVAERLIAPVLKTGRPKGLVSSNLTPSAFTPKTRREGSDA